MCQIFSIAKISVITLRRWSKGILMLLPGHLGEYYFLTNNYLNNDTYSEQLQWGVDTNQEFSKYVWNK